jgi:uncharacterized protein (TIRG00374 family)
MWIGFAISALFLAYFFKDVDWVELGRVLAGARWAWLIPSTVLVLSTYPVRAYRWWYLLPRVPESTFRNRFTSTVIGFMATSIFPLRAGEVVRAALFSLKSGVPIGVSFASLILERVLDLICVLFALGICLAAFPGAASAGSLVMAQRAGLVLSGVVVLIILVLIALKFSPDLVRVPLGKVLSLLPGGVGKKIQHLVDSVIEGLTIVQGVGEVAWLLAISVFHWTIPIVACMVAAKTLDLPLTFMGSMVIFVFTALAAALPQAPGFVGVYQVAIVESLKLLDAPLGQANAFALVWWLLSIGPITLTGFAATWLEGLSMAQVRESRTAKTS